MAEVIAQANVSPSSFSRLDFIVLAPEASISTDKFHTQMERDSVRSKVKQRVSAYDGALDSWYKDYFEPTLNCIELYVLSWEEAIQWISNERVSKAEALSGFYNLCLNFK